MELPARTGIDLSQQPKAGDYLETRPRADGDRPNGQQVPVVVAEGSPARTGIERCSGPLAVRLPRLPRAHGERANQ